MGRGTVLENPRCSWLWACPGARRSVGHVLHALAVHEGRVEVGAPVGHGGRQGVVPALGVSSVSW